MSILSGLLDETARRDSSRPALRVDDSTWSYGDLAEAVERCAGNLHERGIVRGSRIALSASNGPEFATVVLAAARLGATIIMVSTGWREHEIRHAFELTRPTHVVHDGTGAADLTPIAKDQPLLSIAELGDVPPEPVVTNEHPAPDDIAVMVFSSGTTGLPKAVRHSHRSLLAATRHWVDMLGMTADDRLQIATPPSHILGLLNLLAVVSVGASVRLHRRFVLDVVLRAIERDRITIEMAVAPIALAIASHPDLERFDLSSLRYIMWGATPVTPSVAETVTARTGVRFLPAYGASELPVIAVNPVHEPHHWRLDSVGLPPPGIEVRVADLETGEVVAAGGVGELQVRGPSQMVGYLPESANDDAFVDGWYRTGDVGWLEADGWVHITDRLKEMIKVSGFQVAPAEIETILLGHPGVQDCAAFGIPDPRTGEAIVAAVVRTGTVSAGELRDHVAASLAGYKRLHEVVFVDRIPRLPSGKVLRRELKSAYLT